MSFFKKRQSESKVGGAFDSNDVRNYIVDAEVLGKTVPCCLIDSGSPYSFIRPSLLSKAVLDCSGKSRISFSAVSGSDRYTIDTTCVVKFSIGSFEFTHRFYLFEECNFPMLVATDFLYANGFILNFDDNTIRYKGHEIPHRNVPTCINCVSVSDVVIRSCTCNCVTVNTFDFNINNELNVSERNKIDKLIREFSDCFSFSESDYGRTSLVKHTIELNDSTPHKIRPYRQPQCAKENIQTAITSMINNGIIRESNSAWCSPFFLVQKKTSGNQPPKYRFVVDYRRLNKKTIADCFPIPLVTELLEGLHGAAYYTKLDMASGFWQIELSEQSKHLTAFQANNSLYEFNVLPFGLRNASASFQRLLQTIFADLNILPYVDDIIIASKNFGDHMQTIRNVFWRFRKSGLKLNPAKCHFADPSIIYLGHLVNKDAIRPDPEKVDRLKCMRVPSSKKELKAFCGFVSYLSKFVKNFSSIMKPLFEAQNKPHFNWSEECQQSFDNIVSHLSNDVMLRYPDYEKEFFIDVDASNYALAGVLYQSHGPIAFYSRVLNSAETNYSTTDREFLALVNTIQHFRSYVLGRKFKVFSDHKPLSFMLSGTPANSRHARYLIILEEYNFDIEYKKGVENVAADTLSRLATSRDATSAIFVEDSGIWVTKQNGDSYIKSIKELLNSGRRKDGFSMDSENILCYYGKRVVPESEQSSVINMYHLNGHFSASKVRESVLGAGYWFPLMRSKIAKHITGCRSCVSKSGPGFTKNNICLPKSPLVEPFEFLSIDLVGPLPVQRSSYRYVLTMIDHSTRWLEAVALRNCSASDCAQAILKTWIYRYGPPAVLHSDNGPQFTSSVLQKLTQAHNIRQSHSTPYHPKGNSIVERVHRTLKDRLISAGGSWVEHLPSAVYNMSTSTALPPLQPVKLPSNWFLDALDWLVKIGPLVNASKVL